MTPERWQQMKEVFQAARECARDRREVYLDEACAGDAELREQMAALLAADEGPGSFLQKPVAGVFDTSLGDGAEGKAEQAVVGGLIGPYRIERQLGSGGMGVVYLARDTRLGRPVALKLLKSRFTQDAKRVRRFQQEARAASCLNHPNILTVYEFGEVDGAHFIAAEFVAGQTMRERISRGAPQLGEALDWAIQIASALAAAHEAEIIHRDIKPENVMVRPDGLVKVLDFGLAKLIRSDADPYRTAVSFAGGQTQPGVVLGTINYMSPEQSRGETVDARADLFALGVVCYELVTGRRPFDGPSASHVLVAIQDHSPPPLAHHAPGLPAELQPIVDRALAKPPAARYQTARELGDDLRRLKEELEFAARLQRTTAGEPAALTMNVGAVTTATNISTLMLDAARATELPATLPATLPAPPLNQLQRWAARAKAFAGRWRGNGWLGGRAAAIKSVAVLPFANVGDDPRMEYLPDGITESLINSLAQLPGLRVMARGTVFSYKGRAVDPRQVGAALDVRAVVLGRVARRGQQLVIGVEMVDVRDGARLWGEEYARPLTDIFAVQEEVAREIAQQLRLKLTRAAEQQLARRYTADVEAYQLYLKGRYHFLRFNRADQEQALAYFRQVVARDPQYALAWTGIADAYADCSSQYIAAREAMPRAKEAALRALAIDDRLAEAHHSLAVVKWFGDWDWTGAEASFRRALKLNPNAATTYGFYSDFLLRLQRFDEALTAARRCQQLDPLSTHGSIMVSKGLYYLRRHAEAEAQCRQTLILDPHYFWAHVYLAHNFARQGRRAEAITELQRALAINRHDAPLSHLCCLCAATGQMAEARALLDELEEQSRQRHVSPVHRAQAYAGLGDRDRAIELLRQAYDERADHLLSLNINPFFDSLRGDPRFAELLRGIGLAP